MIRLIILALLIPGMLLAQTDMPEVIGDGDNQATMNVAPVSFQSIDGDFRVIFPTGCGKIVSKIPSEEPVDENGDPLPVVYVSYCDRYKQKGEGCSVTTFFNVKGTDQTYPGSEQVIDRVMRMLKTMSVTVTQDKPLRKELADGTFIEGIDVLASDPAGAGQAWVRGMLYQGDIYLLTAWKSDGELAMDQEYIAFFNSFEPGVD